MLHFRGQHSSATDGSSAKSSLGAAAVPLAAIAALVGLLLGCMGRPSAGDVPPAAAMVTARAAAAAAAAFPQEDPRPFAFGMEYVFPINASTNGYKIAHHYRELGATWAKFNGPGTHWDDIEPDPPVAGVHRYQWRLVDEAVRALQGAGFPYLTIVIGPRSKWGCRGEEGFFSQLKVKLAASPPKDEHWGDYLAWVEAFVERYDMDGVDDMPGLKVPVRHYEILTEAQGEVCWRGTVEQYVELLRRSHAAAKRANPDTKIILSGFWFADLFDKGPLSDAEIERKLRTAPSQYPANDVRHKTTQQFRGIIDFNKRILEEKDYFDEVEFHLLSNYTAVEGTVDWIRRRMKENGYSKPIWVGDGGALTQIPCHNRKGMMAAFTTFNQFEPALYDDGDVIYEVLTGGKSAGGYTHAQVRAWFYKDQACYLAKSLITEMGLKLAGTNIYTWLDGKPNTLMSGAMRNWQIGGLREGNFHPKAVVGLPRPSFYTYKMIIDRLGQFSDAEKVAHADTRLKGYRFTVAGRPIYALWLDDGVAQKPGQEEAAAKIDLSSLLPHDRVRSIRIITEYGRTQPTVETMPAGDFLLTETPVLVEAADSPRRSF